MKIVKIERRVSNIEEAIEMIGKKAVIFWGRFWAVLSILDPVLLIGIPFALFFAPLLFPVSETILGVVLTVFSISVLFIITPFILSYNMGKWPNSLNRAHPVIGVLGMCWVLIFALRLRWSGAKWKWWKDTPIPESLRPFIEE